ncbi:MAG TPA: 6,7-dimethyl-8-ribityllumazine synthase [Candidatus Angelobacter sp.]|jgi:6,7-dimethyl-8-ribityllumazine synthase|nr:6,7-dimethyl-8-ribityllumazine synthase [Candidatus Angelobacter sp.]
MNVHTGRLDATGMRVGIVVARFNDFVAQRLLEGAIDALVRHGADESDLTVVWVPGSFEVPLAAQELATGGRVDAVVCLGVVVRGDTPHFDYVAGEASKGVGAVGLQAKLPVSFGVVTTETMEQAIDRAGGKHGNKGADAALAAVEMVSLLRTLRAAQKGTGVRRVSGSS